MSIRKNKQAEKAQKSDFLDMSEMDQRWVLNEIEKGRTDLRDGKVTPLPKTFKGFLEELNLEILQGRTYRQSQERSLRNS